MPGITDPTTTAGGRSARTESVQAAGSPQSTLSPHMRWSPVVLVCPHVSCLAQLTSHILQVLLLSLSWCQAFTWNFFFGTDYMGKTFIVQRDPQQGLLNRQTQSKDDTQMVKMKLEKINNINRNKSKYLRIIYR